MPLYRAGDRLLYFCHVPKCAGTSVTEYLEARFGPPAFQDRAHRRDPARHPWSRTSPQHIDRASLARILPPGFYDTGFAIVRHPVDRLQSVFAFQKREKTIPKRMPFWLWLRRLPRKLEADPYIYDNHTRPMTDLVPENLHIFRLEDGLQPLMDYLDAEFGPAPPGIEMGHEKKDARAKPRVSRAQKARIVDIYAADFETFGYAP